MNEITDLETWLHADCQPTAVYFADADCVEYVAEDTTCVYRRVDAFLTLIYDETNEIVVGFKLKGFRRMLDAIRAELDLGESGYVMLVSVLEAVVSKLGNDVIGDTRRRSAYMAAAKLARDVKLYDYPLAA